MIETSEILQTMRMIQEENFDIRTITLGINLLDCSDQDAEKCAQRVYDKVCRTADRLVKQEKADIFLVDFHAEATSEKKALGYFLDGRVSAVWGTHTHVQTADERILPQGTGFLTDLGMTGAQESVIGVKYQQSVSYFRGELGPRFESSDLDCALQGAIFDIDEKTGRCRSVQRGYFYRDMV